MPHKRIDLSPQTLWNEFERFAAKPNAGEVLEIVAIRSEADEATGTELREMALKVLTGLADAIRVVGRQAWGDPDHLFERSRRDTTWPAKNAPAFLEPYLYPQGVPVVLHRVVGWNRKGKRGADVIAFAYVDEDCPYGDETLWDMSLYFRLLPPTESDLQLRDSSPPATITPVPSRNPRRKRP